MKNLGMVDSGAFTDWTYLYEAGRDGQLMNLLAKLPRERWAAGDEYGDTLIYHACRGLNVAALVMLIHSGTANVNAGSKLATTPAHIAARCQPRMLEVLCAAGANLRACNVFDYAPIDFALAGVSENAQSTTRVLLANGVRLSTAHGESCRYITPELQTFERGVLRCRAAVVAMLRVKKVAKLHHVDKFLMRELAYAMWATRTYDQWQK